jgi:hypothetical protein
MPFDGTNFQPGLIRLFDDMLDFFGPDGENWAQGSQIDNDARCLIGALKGCRARLGMPRRDKAAHYLRRAIAHYYSYYPSSIVAFNDMPYRTFNDIRIVIVMAREMAEHADPEPRQLRFALL